MMTNLQNKTFTAFNPVEIDDVVEQMRQTLEILPWISNAYHIAQRFYTKVGDRSFYYPETFIPNPSTLPNNKNLQYHRLTPDSDYTGMVFFMVSDGKANDSDDFINYQVSAIFSVNLSLIDDSLLKSKLFTQDLMKSARTALIGEISNMDYAVKFISETRDLREVYKEFVLDDIEQYNRAPLQCFRMNFSASIGIDEC